MNCGFTVCWLKVTLNALYFKLWLHGLLIEGHPQCLTSADLVDLLRLKQRTENISVAAKKKKIAKICDTLCIVLLNFANMWKYCLRNIAKGSSIICPLIQCMSSVIAHLVIWTSKVSVAESSRQMLYDQ